MLPEDKLTLKDLINLDDWQKIQDNFSTVTDISLRTLDAEGNLIIPPSREPRLCSQLLNESGRKNVICGDCLPAFLGGEAAVDKNLNYVCRAGLHNFILPIRLNQDRVLGYIILGPVILVIRKQKEEYRKAAEELSLSLEDYWSALLEIKVVSLYGMQSLIKLIEGISHYVINLAYRNRTKEKEVIMALDSAKLDRLFDVLLDAAFEVSQADIGSVMFLDEAHENLSIRASRGIPEEITSKVRVRVGEGLAGLAVKENRSLLLDEQVKDNRIKSYLNRPYISSSMVIPIKVEDKVVGVMNLGALRTSAVRFKVDNVQMMNKLVNLATLAFSPIR